MRNIIVGTAGHIDHGKTALVRALTGIDADRLAEEKRRGITIDLGFAHLQLTNDIRLGFIDVPGHERFVRNMLAGAAGIDMVLFVVAADESIKPQTREHFEICKLLKVRSGIVAITKADLAGPELTELVRLEVEEFVAGSFLEAASVVPVSSTTGEGIEELRAELAYAARAAAEKDATGWFRLPVDRSFTMRGFGTVVTGTLISGTLKREQEVELYPTGRRLRVRNVQVYGRQADQARAGQRTAVNLPDIEHAEIERGMVLSEPGRFRPVTAFDCRVDLLANAKPLKNNAPVHLHLGAAEIEARVRLLARQVSLKPGGSAWARVTLSQPGLVLPGDRFILRMFSPVTTIGGGVVVDISNRKYRAADDVASRLESLLKGDAASRVRLLVSEHPNGIEQSELISLTGLRSIPVIPAIETAGKSLISSERVSNLKKDLVDSVRQFHKEHPLLPGIPKPDLKARVASKAGGEVFDFILAGTAGVVTDNDVVRLATHRVALKADEELARTAIQTAFDRAGLTAPAVPDVLKASGIESARARTLLQILLREGKLVKIADDFVLSAIALASLREQLAKKQGQRFAVPEFKEWTGVSRKYAIPLLEHLDRNHVTRREGDQRVIL